MKKYILFGSGVRAARILAALEGNYNIAYIVDNDKGKQNREIELNGSSYSVCPPEALNNEKLDAVEVIIGSVHAGEMLEQLEKVSRDNAKVDNVRYIQINDGRYLDFYIVSFAGPNESAVSYDFSQIHADTVVFKLNDKPCSIELDEFRVNGELWAVVSGT